MRHKPDFGDHERRPRVQLICVPRCDVVTEGSQPDSRSNETSVMANRVSCATTNTLCDASMEFLDHGLRNLHARERI